MICLVLAQIQTSRDCLTLVNAILMCKYPKLSTHNTTLSIHELAANNSNAKQLSILHTNIRSISLHRDEIVNLCAQTQKPFDVIGVSET